MKYSGFLMVLLLCCIGASAQYKGNLFIIGGGEIDDTLRQAILTTGKWKKGDKIAVVTLASGWDSSYIYSNLEFRKLTGENTICIDSAALQNPLSIDSLRQAKIVFLGGGDQERFMQRIEGTPVKAILQQLYRNGATIAGTSAGASVMSRLMITGTSLRDGGSTTGMKGIWKGSVEYKTGLALLDSVLIDQHFVARSRYNRMISSLLDHPAYQCIGINESTAILVQGRKAKVIGANQVIVMSKPVGIKSTAQGDQGAKKIEFSVYLPGDEFTIKR